MPAARSASPRRLRRFIVPAIVLAVLAGALYWWTRDGGEGEPAFRTARAEQGDIRVAISATGTLNALSTVDVGSEVSGRLAEVLVDYNERVTRGQVIARIDPSTFQAQIEQSDAAIASARAGLETARATLRNAELEYQRLRALVDQKLVARGDVDRALSARDQARAQVAQSEAQVRQQEASAENSRLNLGRSVIRSPVDGVVLTRAVEPGQTVAASLQAPVLFKIAEDLAKMEIMLAVDEADIGQVAEGQRVNFTVDAYPERQFEGRVRQVRLSATNTSNVITYPVVVAVDNADQTLFPGMTANAEIEVSRRDGVLKVPNAALRFKPPEGMVAEESQNGTQGGARGGMSDDLPRLVEPLKLTAPQQAAFDAALAEMRARADARRAPQGDQRPAGGSLFGGRGPGGGQSGPFGGGAMPPQVRQRMLERFNQQFGAFRDSLDEGQRAQWDAGLKALLSARRAPVYRLVDGRPEMVMLRIGASDGSSSEVSGALSAGDEVIVGVGVGANAGGPSSGPSPAAGAR